MKRINFILSAALPAIIFVQSALPVFADIGVEVTDNGAGTQNNVSVASQQNSTVSQSNEATLNNSAITEANTGGNTASDNAGAVQMSTGDIASQTEVTNDLNTSVVTAGCCESSLNVTVDGNGVNSVNTIHTNLSTTTTINVTQIAAITNNINLAANTGNNRASNNSGNVEIKTGNIKAHGSLQNEVNQAQVTVGPGAWDIHIINRDNGVDSTNVIVVDFVNDLLLWKNHVANIKNNVYADLNTGGNFANRNLNNVLIDTGNIDFSFDVVNGPINTGSAEVLCCDDGAPIDQGHEPQPNPPPQPGNSSTASSSVGGASGTSKTGDVLGALTQMLPATGASAIHFWILAVVYLLTFLSGLYLRLRAGRSPTSRLAFTGYQLLAY